MSCLSNGVVSAYSSTSKQASIGLMLDLLVIRELMLACYLLISVLAMLTYNLLAAYFIKSYAKIIYLYIYYSVVVC
jgi:hypothetical protein